MVFQESYPGGPLHIWLQLIFIHSRIFMVFAGKFFYIFHLENAPFFETSWGAFFFVKSAQVPKTVLAIPHAGPNVLCLCFSWSHVFACVAFSALGGLQGQYQCYLPQHYSTGCQRKFTLSPRDAWTGEQRGCLVPGFVAMTDRAQMEPRLCIQCLVVTNNFPRVRSGKIVSGLRS